MIFGIKYFIYDVGEIKVVFRRIRFILFIEMFIFCYYIVLGLKGFFIKVMYDMKVIRFIVILVFLFFFNEDIIYFMF